MRLHRIFMTLLVVFICFGFIAARLFWLQSQFIAEKVGGKAAFIRKSVAQRRTTIVLNDGRGVFVDRKGRPLTGLNTNALLVHKRDASHGLLLQASRIASILGVPVSEWLEFASQIEQPSLWRRKGEREPATLNPQQIEQIKSLGFDSVAIVPYVRRYAEPPVASHLLGFVTNPDRIGMAGLERSFDRFLRVGEPSRLVFYRDAKSVPLNGLEERVVYPENPNYPLKAIATIDRELQVEVEKILNKRQVSDGAVVVLDAESSDILAMASKPDYNPYSVDPKADNWQNRALIPEIPGSIFKVVVAAAALEEGLAHPGERFECNGAWDRFHLRCWLPGGHGHLTLEEAFAESCNVVFAQLAVRLGANKLLKTADRLGIGRLAGWSDDKLPPPFDQGSTFTQLDGEWPGRIFDAMAVRSDPALLAQTGIGQRDVRISPLQAAEIAAMVANNGRITFPRVVSELRMSNNRPLLEFPPKTSHRNAISRPTALWLKHAMRLTAIDGTARLLSGVDGGAAGKTGTAEIGSTGKVHHWFIGFAPAEHPRYAFAVLIRNQASDRPHQALVLTKELLGVLGQLTSL